jgi:molybdopterin synthase catalytic subunit
MPDPALVSEGAVRLIGISDQPLSVDAVLASVSDRAAGGVALFVGIVRDHDGERSVSSLEYEAHPAATEVLRQVATDVASKHDLIAISGVHRVGLLKIGDLAVVAGVACAHRGDAFAAAREFVDELKARVPIWKRQTFTDGDVEWVGIASLGGLPPGESGTDQGDRRLS